MGDSLPKFRTHEAARLYRDRKFAANQDARVDAVDEILKRLPRSLPDIETLLNSTPHRASYEVHFTIFCLISLPDRVLKIRRKLQQLTERYLMNIDTEAAQAAWMAGDALGWRYRKLTREDLREIKILESCAVQARYRAGRLGAIHGLQHVLDRCDASTARRLLRLLGNVLRSDSSLRVRDYAHWTLDSGGCWDQERASPALRIYAHKLRGAKYPPGLLARWKRERYQWRGNIAQP